MEALQARHRKEQRDLVAKVTQKKKQASKKTRKGVNDECEQLERELKERQAREVADLLGGNPSSLGADEDEGAEATSKPAGSELENGVTALSLEDSDGDNNNNDDDNGSAKHTPDEPPDAAAAASPGHAQPRKPNRAKARLARRAAEQDAMRAEAAAEAASMPDQKEVERRALQEEFRRRGLTERVIRADGHCLYSAVADQLQARGLTLKPKIALAGAAQGTGDEVPAFRQVRHAAAAYMGQHEADFEPFLEEPLDGYLTKVRDTGEWGGQLELLALAKTYGVDINVLQGNGRLEKIEGSTGGEASDIWLAYYRHGFGLGEHYNSLRKTP